MYLIRSLLVLAPISPYNRKCLWEKKSGNKGSSPSEPEETSSADSATPKVGRSYMGNHELS